MAGIDPAKIKQIEGATYYVSEEPTLAEIALFPLPVNFKIVNSVDSTYKIVSFKADGTRLELTTDSSGGTTNVITEDSDTVAFTGNGTAGTPLKAEVKSDGLDYIPLTGTEEGKPVTGDIETYNFFKTYSVAPNGNNFGYYFDEGSYHIFNDGFVQFDIGYDLAFGPDVLTLTLNGPSRKGIIGNAEYDKLGDRKAFAQLSDVYDAISYSTTETKIGGKWIDDKDIYTITQLTVDTPPTMDTAFPTEVIGTYTVYKYTKP